MLRISAISAEKIFFHIVVAAYGIYAVFGLHRPETGRVFFRILKTLKSTCKNVTGNYHHVRVHRVDFLNHLFGRSYVRIYAEMQVCYKDDLQFFYTFGLFIYIYLIVHQPRLLSMIHSA